MLKIFVVTISIGLASCGIQNYCNTKICDLESYKHITCDFQETARLSPSCSANARVIQFSDDIKQKYVDLHNKYRNKIANGEAGYKTATNMASVDWNEDLATYAVLNVMRCKTEHDCHSTNEMKHSGQNIFIGYGDDMSEVAETAVKAWYAEKIGATQENLDNCCDLSVGHFTQLARDRANRIGCAGGQFDSQGSKVTYVVCNYSFGNYPSKAYTVGPPASQCKTGNNPQYPALCSASEPIDPNNVN